MGRRKPPYLKPPTHPILTALPPELLHNIFECLQLRDVRSARLSCCLLARIGLDHFNDQVPLVFTRDKFTALTEIAEHPVIAKRMRSLWWAFGMLKHKDYAAWNSARPATFPVYFCCDLDELIGPPSGRSERDHRAASRAMAKRHQEYVASKSAIPESDLSAAFATHQGMCQDQDAILEERFDLHCLQALFKGCPNIREAVVTDPGDTIHGSRMTTAAFEKGMTTLLQYTPGWEYAGLREVLTLTSAIVAARVELDSLTLSGVSYRLLDANVRGIYLRRLFKGEYLPTDGGTEPTLGRSASGLLALVRPLRRLCLGLTALPDEDDENYDVEETGPEEFVDSVNELFNSGQPNQILREAKELRVLKLRLPLCLTYEMSFDEASYADVQSLLGSVTYPHLYEFSLAHGLAHGTHFVEFLLRHKATLRRLNLSYMHFPSQETWVDVFTKIGGKLPKLQEVRLRGDFDSLGQKEFHFDILGADSRRIHPQRDALETLILKGGEVPEDLYQLPFKTCYPHEQPGYMPPGKSDNDLNDKYEEDDPALTYDSDEIDW